MDRRIFITGGAHGIGQAIVEAFCREGYRVAFCDTDEQRGRSLAETTGASRLWAMCSRIVCFLK